ncbi:MAG TPA: Fic family protein [Chthoniobacterales bacterium]|jgi:Fic family protein
MKRGLSGRYEVTAAFGEQVRAFVPHPLPPAPPVDLDGALGALLDRAAVAIGRLDGISIVLPDPDIFLYSYIRKEAVLSSMIEGTQSSLSDLLLYEMDGAPGALTEDAAEVSRYVAALEKGLHLLREGMPISLRLLREIHAELLAHGRGSNKEPGEFKRSQNWIGGTRPGNARFVPTPPDLVLETLGAWEKFLHDDPVPTRTLVKAALAHVQFETIHPFLDGNGRLGRLLITFLLCSEGALRQPLLYLSLYLKQHRARYYELLQEVRLNGDWEAWLEFFLTGVRETAEQAAATASELLALFQRDRQRLYTEGGSGASVLRLHEHLQRRPITSAAQAAGAIQASIPTATSALRKLESLGIIRELTGGAYRRLYGYSAYLEILNEGTDPIFA